MGPSVGWNSLLIELFWQGSNGWRSGESARLPLMWPGFKSRRQRHMWVEFVVGSLLCSERFFSGYFGFPLSARTSMSNSNSTKNQVDEEPLCGCATSKSLFIYSNCAQMDPGPAESDFGLQGRIDTLGLKEIFLNFQCIY